MGPMTLEELKAIYPSLGYERGAYTHSDTGERLDVCDVNQPTDDGRQYFIAHFTPIGDFDEQET